MNHTQETDARSLRQYYRHTGNVNIGAVHGGAYKRINHHLCDVFTGIGFNPPTRYMLTRGKWTRISGPFIDPQVATMLPLR